MVLTRNLLNEELRDQYRRPGDVKRQFEEALTGEMKEHGFLAHDDLLQYHDFRDDLSEMVEFDHPQYPDVEDLIGRVQRKIFKFSGEEYFG
ncbi:uncharacterized protein N7482_003969 [Penicillium canariense]|uniref:Uncharacterized protein n=1 Tax=Penicillium canariense TaxID=189055 RepID=A0A9W9I5R4_9EURO|nr:uncharacterized protein N7482_003969 [Penicillium canariense]KAJ5168375.1 hypothetical protein N7482_003969 [Penicillium canariense]